MHHVQGFRDEIIMDGEAQPVILWVIHLILPERDIPDGKVKEIPWEACILISGDMNPGIGVKQLRNAPADAIQLHAVKLGF